MRSVDVDGLDIDSHDLAFGSLVVNGVDVVPLVEAELDRRFPGRDLQRSQTPEGLREGWVAVRSAWQRRWTRRRRSGWTPVSTASGPWPRRSVTWCWRPTPGSAARSCGVPQPFHEIGQIFTGAAEMGFDMSIFRDDDPAYAEILAVRAEHRQLVTDFLATATPELLAEQRDNPWGGGDWHPSVGDCIRVILEEEWAHLRYVRRDLARLE